MWASSKRYIGARNFDPEVTVESLTPQQVNDFIGAELPFATELGIHCESLGVDVAVSRWHFSERWLRPVNFVCGPVMMALADVSLYFALFTRGGLSPHALTNELKMNFLRPAASRVDVLARARVLKRGRRVVYGAVDLWEDGAPDRLVAHATSSYVMPD
jgi:uncharacterized protein (TIGR00369 family)